ncbi:MAG TPA: ATP-binding protein [Stellaceae bacterium]|nr:ATP-binding protein [Stellaceae bacterium]
MLHSPHFYHRLRSFLAVQTVSGPATPDLEQSARDMLAAGLTPAAILEKLLAQGTAGAAELRPAVRVLERQMQDTALRAAEVRFRQLRDSAIDTAIITTDASGNITSWSEGAYRILGWAEAEMLGTNLSRVFIESDRALGLLAAEMNDAVTLGRGGHEGWRLRKDGSLIWATGELAPVREESGQVSGFVKILRDRTFEKYAEEALQEETRTLEILNRANSALARESDLETLVQGVTDAGVELIRAEFGAFFYNVLNDAGESYMLYTLSGVSKDRFANFPMPRNTAVFGPTFAGTEIVISDDITQDPRYGHNAPHAGMPKGHLPVCSYLAVPVVSRDGGVLGGLFFGHSKPSMFTNRSQRLLTGLAAEAAIAIDNVRLVQAMQNEITERQRVEDALLNLNATLEDQVNERSEQLRLHAEALRQAQKMEAVGQLTGGVAHDFNNILQIILGNLETLSRNLPPEAPRLHRAAENATAAASRAAALTQRLLAFSRRQPLNPKPVDVNALVEGMSELLLRSLGELIKVEIRLVPKLWQVEADPNELESALVNLAVNARDAMSEGGDLVIETANATLDETYCAIHTDVLPGEYVMIAVRDNGSGMETETIARVFEPFFTTKPEGQGTGLGLSQVYGFVRQSSGHVRIDSRPDQGTSVTIYLPRLDRAIAPADKAAAAEAPESAGEETILVIEDEEAVRAHSVETLRELGYRVIEARDGLEGLKLLAETSHIDLLFTDVVLPGGMTGAEVAARAQSMRPRLKVLFTTGYAREIIVHDGRLDKGIQLLTKPFTFAGLAAKVRDVLDGA